MARFTAATAVLAMALSSIQYGPSAVQGGRLTSVLAVGAQSEASSGDGDDWECQFLLTEVDLPRAGSGTLRVTGALKNRSKNTLTFDETIAVLDLRCGLRFWMVGTPYVYRLKRNPTLEIHYFSSEARIAPGSAKQITVPTGMRSEVSDDLHFWLVRMPTNGFELKEDPAQLSVLPPGLYGVTSQVDVWPIGPQPRAKSANERSFVVRSQNMLWIEVGADGTATPVTTRPAP